MYKVWARGSVDISAKNKQAISFDIYNPKDIHNSLDIHNPMDIYNQKNSQTTAKLLMKLISEEIARKIYNEKNNYEELDTSDKKQEGRNLS